MRARDREFFSRAQEIVYDFEAAVEQLRKIVPDLTARFDARPGRHYFGWLFWEGRKGSER